MGLRTHFQAFRSAWREETNRRKTAKPDCVETEFLPAALEITATPPSPAGRAILWLIVAAAVLALIWASFSQVDTVAVAEGRLTPTGRLRTVEAADAGIVRAIDVREGDRVEVGQRLIALDPTVAEADVGAARSEFGTAALARARADALLSSTSGAPARIVAPDGAEPAAIQAEQAAVDARAREYAERRASLAERRTAAQASVRVADANIAKVEQSLPFAERQVKAFETLAAKGFGSPLRLAQEQERYIGLLNELKAEQARRDEAQAQVASLSRDIAQAAAEFRGQAAKEAAEAEGAVATRGEELRKAAQRQSLQQLRAPVAGTIQEVAVTTLGQVAESGKPLVTIVPRGEDLVAEVMVLNKDVGAIRVGDRAVIKLEAYPFTRYGTLTAHVERISADSVVDERRGLVFPTTIRVDPRQAASAGRIKRQPGMSVVAEIVTGRRRVIEYLWSPIARATGEAGRER